LRVQFAFPFPDDDSMRTVRVLGAYSMVTEKLFNNRFCIGRTITRPITRTRTTPRTRTRREQGQ
jgi:hypothetical protein